MEDKNNVPDNADGHQHYEIRVRGQLGTQWMEWFEANSIELLNNNETRLTCYVTDQAALHSLLRKVRDLGVELLSVNRV